MAIRYLGFHIIALVLGVILDRIVGDPHWMPHPIRLIGNLISFLDRVMMGDKTKVSTNPVKERRLGKILCVVVILCTVMLTMAVVLVAFYISEYLWIAVEAILTCYILAAKSLYVESMKVYKALKNNDLVLARYNVSMIVGRDTDCLDEIMVAKAAVETVAENTSDGVIAPLLYTAIGGPILGFAYKAINTMDSMVGYHNDRYEYFGAAAAKLDDIVNYIPSRISAIAIILSGGVVSKKYNILEGIRIFKRDRYNHKSPNSAQSESACAGLLGIQLGGDASYFGKMVSKPTIGDATRTVEYEDIKRTNSLMFGAEDICLVVILLIYYLIIGII